MKKSGTKKIVLFDAHAVLHRAYHALPEFTSSKGEPTGGLYGLSAILIRIIGDLKPDYLAACYDLPEPTFRKQVYEQYKATRAKVDDSLVSQIKRSQDIFKAFHIPIYCVPGFEADDIIGTAVAQLKGEKNLQIIIASGDMDTLQLVLDDKVVVYTLKKGITDTVTYNETKVRERFGFDPALLADYKGLRGDPSDNIVGVPGIGEKTATQLISEFGPIENLYKVLDNGPEQLLKAGIKQRIVDLLRAHEEEAEFSKVLATIRTDAPVEIKLPERPWVETFNLKEAEALFSELEFRSLYERLKSLWQGLAQPQATPKVLADDQVIADKAEVTKAGIALWLLNSDVTTPTLQDILLYAKTADFNQAREKVEAELSTKGLEQVYREIELPLLPIIKRAEERGILIDVAYLKKLSNDYHHELTELEQEIYQLAGSEFNINSPKQLGEVLFDQLKLTTKGLKKTAGGARSTRESELEKLRESHPIIEKILAHRELQKLLSTYIDSIPKLVDSEHRLHTTLNQAGTTTGRMSSNNPNLQNIPVRDGRGKSIRNAFIATPGYELAAFDYSQLEMRILAALAGDEYLAEIFKKDQDVHTAVAARVFGVEEGQVTKEMRRRAKVINFGIAYGMGVNALRQNLDSSREEAEEFYNNYFASYPKIRDYFAKVKADALRLGYTETFFGRRRYFPGLKSRLPYVKAMAERMAINAPIQGTEADLVKIAMQKVDEELQAAGLQSEVIFLLQIHDELLYEIKSDLLPKAMPLIKRVMEAVWTLPLPLKVNAAAGKSWGELVDLAS